MTVVGTSAATFTTALSDLRSAQKSSKGAPLYSRFVNRPLGRVFAATAYRMGWTPNQVTYLSAAFTFAGVVTVAIAPPTVRVGPAVALALVIGYALDSADGQLARLRGGGSVAGEWLDHMIDAVKVASIHVAVLLSLYRWFHLDARWLLVPLLFLVASTVHFFGMILRDSLVRMHRPQTTGLPPPTPAESTFRALLKLPVDYGIWCLSFVVLGFHQVFFGVYAVLAVAMVGYLALAVVKWRGEVQDLAARTLGEQR